MPKRNGLNMAEQILDDANDAAPIKQGAGIAGYGKPPVPVAEHVNEDVHGYVSTDQPKTFRLDVEFLAELVAASKRHKLSQKQILQRGARLLIAELDEGKEAPNG